jgi:hypothetical protein
MRYVSIDGDQIKDWDSFHDVFDKTMGFPEFYGRNMNAWIDCMTYLDDPGAGMSQVTVEQGTVLVLEIGSAAAFKRRCPEQFDGLLECSGFVNFRRREQEEAAVLALSFDA